MTNIRALYEITMEANGALPYWVAKMLADYIAPLPKNDPESFIQNSIDTSRMIYSPLHEGVGENHEKEAAHEPDEVEKVWGRLGAALADMNDMSFKKEILMQMEVPDPHVPLKLNEEEADALISVLTGIVCDRKIIPSDDPRTEKQSLQMNAEITKASWHGNIPVANAEKYKLN